MGYPVTVYDRNKVPGGMLTHGIPSFRLDRKVIGAEIDVLKKMGVKFKMGVEVGKDITIAELRKQGYKGFFLGIGAQKSAKLGIPGEDLNGVYGGVDFLREVNLGNEVKLGKKVAVIGGGNVAMDVVRTAIRVGVNGGVDNVAKIIDPASISPQISQFIDLAISYTQKFLGATDVALGDTRTLILCKKISQTPTAYPRNGGKIAKSPLK